MEKITQTPTSGPQDDKPSTQPTLSTNDGSCVEEHDLPQEAFYSTIVASNDEFHYFSIIKSREDNIGCFFRSKSDGSDITKICHVFPRYINVDVDFIYFIESDYSGEGSIIKMGKNGENLVRIYSGKATDLTLVGNMLYFIEDKQLHKIRKDGSGLTDMKISGRNLRYSDKCLYYLLYNNDRHDIKRYDLLTNEESTIIVDIEIDYERYNVTDDYIFYLNNEDYCIYRMDNNGYNLKKIIDFLEIIEDTEDKEMLTDGLIYLNYDIYRREIYVSMNNFISVYDFEGTFVRNLTIYSWHYENRIVSFADDFIYYLQYVPEGDDLFMRVKLDGSCQEHLLLDENGEFTTPDWWRQF